MCWSAAAAVRLRTGSTTTTFAPRLRASVMYGHRCRFVLMMLQAHTRMNFECTRLSGSTPAVSPIVMA